ncbi:MAG: hypothetical protein MMC33_006207 [Icmadophila ericetorum]|nr:hypothetical protein [Icmadophila ericetorum]
MATPLDLNAWIATLDSVSLDEELHQRNLSVEGKIYRRQARLSAFFDYDNPVPFNGVGRDPASLVGLKIRGVSFQAPKCIIQLDCITEVITILPRALSLRTPRLRMTIELKQAFKNLSDPDKDPFVKTSLEILEATLVTSRRTVKRFTELTVDIEENVFESIGLRLTGMRDMGYIECHDPDNDLGNGEQFECLVIAPQPDMQRWMEEDKTPEESPTKRKSSPFPKGQKAELLT